MTNREEEHQGQKGSLHELCEAILLLSDLDELSNFLKDLCTPQEIAVLSERWRVCKLLDQGDLSYRDIHRMTGAGLVTIGRVARFLKNEPHCGYQKVLKKMKSEEKK